MTKSESEFLFRCDSDPGIGCHRNPLQFFHLKVRKRIYMIIDQSERMLKQWCEAYIKIGSVIRGKLIYHLLDQWVKSRRGRRSTENPFQNIG